MPGVVDEGVKFLQELDSFSGLRRRWLIKRESETSERYGKVPRLRNIDELLSFGIINLDKPPGPTSHEVVAWVKGLLGLRRAGHGGTLEPA